MSGTRFDRGGFSLVEQVVAIASVAVVAAMVVPTVVNQLEKSELSRMESDLRAIEKAVKDFRADVSYWPGSILQLRNPLSSFSVGERVDAFGRPILRTVGKDWKGPYFEPKALAKVTGAGTVMVSAAGTYFTNTLARDTAKIDTREFQNFIRIELNNVSREDAEKLSLSIDGERLLAGDDAGRVRWAEDDDSGKGTLTYYAGPIT